MMSLIYADSLLASSFSSSSVVRWVTLMSMRSAYAPTSVNLPSMSSALSSTLGLPSLDSSRSLSFIYERTCCALRTTSKSYSSSSALSMTALPDVLISWSAAGLSMNWARASFLSSSVGLGSTRPLSCSSLTVLKAMRTFLRKPTISSSARRCGNGTSSSGVTSCIEERWHSMLKFGVGDRLVRLASRGLVVISWASAKPSLFPSHQRCEI